MCVCGVFRAWSQAAVCGAAREKAEEGGRAAAVVWSHLIIVLGIDKEVLRIRSRSNKILLLLLFLFLYW